MNKIISDFYRVFIHPIDPGLFITKYAAKSVVACIVALALSYLVGFRGHNLAWCVYGSLIVVIFRAGNTLKKRKMVAAAICFATIILVPVTTVLASHLYLSAAYLFILSFLIFFTPVIGGTAASTGIGVLIVNLIALNSPDTFTAGLLRSGCILFGSTISYFVIFHLWPLHPEKILSKAGGVALSDIGDYFRAVAESDGTPEDRKRITVIHDRSIESLRRYRRFMEAMNIDPVKNLGKYEGPSALYALLIRLLEAVVGLANSANFAEHSHAFTMLRFKFSELTLKSSIVFDVLAAKVSTGKGNIDLSEINSGISELERELLDLGAYKRDGGLRDEFLEAWGALYGLRNLSLEFDEMSRVTLGGGAV
ncbi:FUSC family membrane protein [Desulfovibrio gilichinskyi]|uniref:FUSC-like inner membrane protein yccS n=1 Tax=Desulfovibrio gilichinskyi TaxID=1519643 RepID=A0A1X7EXI3_9BACT|nr:FUSC family membrane protein [Desulfovibrio gilichinskyi]SMF41585.1 FUSC-like inner membrane protein yccS [Desulfovibrio gilichinskyi]